MKHGVIVGKVDEFRSSRLHSVCHHPLVSLSGKTNGHHALLRCSNSNCPKRETIWNRDVNAAINMATLQLYHLHHSRSAILDPSIPPPRPMNFQCGKEVEEVPMPSHDELFQHFALSLIPLLGD